MRNNVYTVKSGDCAWNFARQNLKNNKTGEITNTDILKEMERLAKVYNCKDSIDFNNKYFAKCGSTFTLKEETSPLLEDNTTGKTIREKNTHFLTCPQESTFVNNIDTLTLNHKKQKQRALQKTGTDWKSTVKTQDEINKLPTDKERVIEWNKKFNTKNKDNYVIIDKKDCTATIYTPDGTIVKQYEILAARNKSDALLKRDKNNPSNSFAATSAGIYTANYRATGRDAYARLYNDRVLTLSNDGLRERGIGNGETGVAFHQIPNGNSYRTEALKKAGVSEENNRVSDGCINFLPEDFDDCMKHISGVGTKVYILPEEKNNYMCVKNGKLHFAQRNYTGNVPTATTKNDKAQEISIRANNPNLRKEAHLMAQTLSDSKKSLIKDLGIDNDTYNELALTTLGIAGTETEFGAPLSNLKKGTYWLKENAQRLVNCLKWIKGDNSINSRGLTQMKLASYTDKDVKNLLKKYSINENNLDDPEKCAIATMIVLSCIYKNELPAIKSNIEHLGLTKKEAVLYCWNGKKNEITSQTATPNKNIYIQKVNSYIDDFALYQYA